MFGQMLSGLIYGKCHALPVYHSSGGLLLVNCRAFAEHSNLAVMYGNNPTHGICATKLANTLDDDTL